MVQTARCQCGAEVRLTDLSGRPRTECPVCRAPLKSSVAPELKPVAKPEAAREIPRRGSNTNVPTEVAAREPRPQADRTSVQPNWNPPAGLCDHAGQRITASKRFAWGPPVEIGDIVSADSNQMHGRVPSAVLPWFIFIGLWLTVYLILGEGMPRVIAGKGDPQVIRLIAIGVGLLAALLSLLWTWPAAAYCTYVGSQGAALLTGRWSSQQPRQVQVILFRDALVLYASATHFYKNFIYQETMFGFGWSRAFDMQGVLAITGQHNYKDQLPPPDHIYHFGLRVEDLWTSELFHRHGPVASADRPIVFPTRDRRIREIRLSRQRIEFDYGDRVESIAIAELGSFDAKRGTMLFEQADAKWFSAKGRFRIRYEDLGNAKLFVYYLSAILRGQQ